MASRLIARMTHALILLFVVSVVGFALLRLMPGDFAEILLMAQMDGTLPDASQVQQFAASNGLDDPLPQQYARWLFALLQGDLGKSFITDEPIINDIALRLGQSLILAVLSLVTALAIAVPLGRSPISGTRCYSHCCFRLSLAGCQPAGMARGRMRFYQPL